MDAISVSMNCQKCNKLVKLTSDVMVYNKQFKTVDGQKVLLTYFDCPSCGTRHFVQADDGYTSKLRSQATKLAVKMIAAKARGKQLPKKQQDKYNKQQRMLNESRRKLNDQLEGRVVFDCVTDAKYGFHLALKDMPDN